MNVSLEMSMAALLLPAVSILISVAVIPIMMRYAESLGMVDMPDPRKVHLIAVPRVGGWGMIIGTFMAVVVFLPIDPAVATYLFGTLVLLGFGAKDDQADIGHYPKFIGQLLAVLPVVLIGDVQVERLPFIEAPLPAFVAIPFTTFAMVGTINALNHSDGLDGLAGGESLLSLSALALIAFAVDVPTVGYIALATVGGTIGFLRFNTHPARVFMGDSGSQFLGFTLAFLVLLLLQRAEDLSPALPALLLGLPLIDILAVLAQRIYHGLNWFEATRNHIHHRLLDLGFDHYESVVLIYGIQAFFVVSAIFLQTGDDTVILALYLGTCALIFVALVRGEAKGWRLREDADDSGTESVVSSLTHSWLLTRVPLIVVSIGVPMWVLGSCAMIGSVPKDYGWTALALLVVMMIEMLRGRADASVGRIVIYSAALFVVFLGIATVEERGGTISTLELIFVAILAVAVGLGVRFSNSTVFGTTPLDYLVLFTVVLVALFPLKSNHTELLSWLVIEGFVVLYGCELLMNKTNGKRTALNLAALGALSVLSVRGIAGV